MVSDVTAEEDQIRGRGKGQRPSYDLGDSNPALCTSFSGYIYLNFSVVVVAFVETVIVVVVIVVIFVAVVVIIQI